MKYILLLFILVNSPTVQILNYNCDHSPLGWMYQFIFDSFLSFLGEFFFFFLISKLVEAVELKNETQLAALKEKMKRKVKNKLLWEGWLSPNPHAPHQSATYII